MVGNRPLVLLVFLAVVLSLSACVATFREGTVQPPTSWPITTASGKQSISLLIRGERIDKEGLPLKEYRNSFPTGEMTDWAVKKFQVESIVKAYRDSGLFSDVEIGAFDTDLRAEVHVLRRVQVNELLCITWFLTLSAVPCSSP